MQLKALAAIVSVAFTLGVQAAPNPFDHAAGVKGVLKRSSHGKDMSQVSKRAMALVAKKRDSNHKIGVGKQCKTKTKTTPTTPTPQQPDTSPTPQQPDTTPTPQQPETTPDTIEPISSPAPVPNPGKSISVPATDNNNNTSNTGSGSTSLDAVSQQWLDEHNKARADHGAAPLTWSSEAAAFAEKYAAGCSWPHSGSQTYGENLYASMGSATPADAVGAWMSESSVYTLVNPPRIKNKD